MFKCLIVLSTICFSLNLIKCNDLLNYRASPKLMLPLKSSHANNDVTLNQLDDSLAQISTVYMQALFSGTHTPELDMRMRKLEMELFDQLDSLFKQERLQDYMKYEAEVTRQLILYNMLKKLFGYTLEVNEKN
ncbi:uncharacterized protein LOC135959851 [Calliphora vicina]|uniref:uncharacterized protein LOC135959851 n=1 Tax=Calliphora vicina TaxID=7373 RepID=UPI00325BDAA2